MLGKITKTAVEGLKPGELLWDADQREVVKGFGARRQKRGCFLSRPLSHPRRAATFFWHWPPRFPVYTRHSPD
jgi:hypothetical protein